MRIARNEPAVQSLTSFMAECFWPGVTEQDLVHAGARARRAAQAISSNGGAACYLGAILVPTDEIALCLFEAASLEVAAEVNRQAAIPSERILEIVRLGDSRRGRDHSTARERSFDEPLQ